MGALKIERPPDKLWTGTPIWSKATFCSSLGLFTADQKLRGDRAIYTRQNAAGTRRGLEVPEERDYYPYWGPTPWKDIAIMVSDQKTLNYMKKYVKSHDYGHKRKYRASSET